MRAYIDTFNRMKEVLENSSIDIDLIAVWMRSLERHISGGGKMMKDRNVFIEFPSGQQVSDGSYHQYNINGFRINVHIVVTNINENYLELWEYCQSIHEELAHQDFNFPYENGGFSELKYDSFAHEQASKDKYQMTISYTTNLVDSTTRREKKQISINLGQKINKEINNDG